jgi:hypothetical protein
MRGADGTYSYQYVADTSDIAQKEQDLAKLNNELYNLDKDTYNESLEEVYNLYAEYIEKMRELASDGDGLTAEDLAYLDRYKEAVERVVGDDEIGSIWSNLSDTVSEDYKMNVEDVISTASTSFATMATKTAEDAFGTVAAAYISAVDSASGLFTTSVATLKTLYGEAKTKDGGLDSLMSGIVKNSGDLVTKMENMVLEFTKENGILASLKTVNERYDGLADNL